MDWSSMTGRERDAALAEAMGWKLDYEFAEATGAPSVPALRDQYDEYGFLPTFTTSLDAMRLVEEVIQKRGLQREYLHQLVGMQQGSVALDIDCLDYKDTMPRALWSLVCATPAQRVEAAYIVLRESPDAPPA